jgi:hypothetical protein
MGFVNRTTVLDILLQFHVSLAYVTTTMLLQRAEEMHVTRCEWELYTGYWRHSYSNCCKRSAVCTAVGA